MSILQGVFDILVIFGFSVVFTLIVAAPFAVAFIAVHYAFKRGK